MLYLFGIWTKLREFFNGKTCAISEEWTWDSSPWSPILQPLSMDPLTTQVFPKSCQVLGVLLEAISAYWSKISLINTSMCNTKFQRSFKTRSVQLRKTKTKNERVRMFISNFKLIWNFGTLFLLDFLALFPPQNCCFVVLKLWMKYIFAFRLLDLPSR